jgi:hypothetical protein
LSFKLNNNSPDFMEWGKIPPLSSFNRRLFRTRVLISPDRPRRTSKYPTNPENMAGAGMRVNVKRDSFTNFALLALVVSGLTFLYLSATFRAAFPATGNTSDSAASEDSEILLAKNPAEVVRVEDPSVEKAPVETQIPLWVEALQKERRRPRVEQWMYAATL